MTASTGTVKLSEMLGVEDGIKQKANKRLGADERKLGATALLNGLTKTYRPSDAEDTDLPSDTGLKVQVKALDVLRDVEECMVDLWDVVLTREAGNCVATGDIIVSDVVVAANVPVTYLLFMDKQLDDLRKILVSIPVHDPSKDWTEIEPGLWRSRPEETHRTRREKTVLELSPATEKHPRQVQVYDIDKVVGYWTRVDFTGSLPADRVFLLVRRVEALQRAVKQARMRANATEIEHRRIGQQLFDYLLAP